MIILNTYFSCEYIQSNSQKISSPRRSVYSIGSEYFASSQSHSIATRSSFNFTQLKCLVTDNTRSDYINSLCGSNIHFVKWVNSLPWEGRNISKLHLTWSNFDGTWSCHSLMHHHRHCPLALTKLNRTFYALIDDL